ncbi:MAG: hypothetical protein WBL28_06840 [Methylotenera sp.]
MANDSAVVNEFTDGKVEFTTGRKFFALDGVGVVTMWGARDGNKLITHLESLKLSPDTHSVEDLANAVNRYLTETYKPHEDDIGDTGYHVGGFTSDGQVRLYHIFWNVRGSGNALKNMGAYTFELHHLPPKMIGFMYNGRHDVVSKLMQSLVDEMNQGKPTNFPLTPSGVCRLAHFVLRASSEITKEVAPTFLVHILSPTQRCLTVTVDSVIPSTDDVFAESLQKAGLS